MKSILKFNLGDPILNCLLGYENELSGLYNYTMKSQPNFPLYNISKVEEKTYIEVALAGYSKDDIAIETEGNTLTIKTAEDRSSKDRDYIVQNIAFRDFELPFKIASGTKVKKATMDNGMLTVTLETDKANRRQSVKID